MLPAEESVSAQLPADTEATQELPAPSDTVTLPVGAPAAATVPEIEKDPVRRDPEKYYVSIFGTLSFTGT